MQRALLTALSFGIVVFASHAQNPQADSLLAEMRKAEEPSGRISLLYKLLYEEPTLTQQQRIHYAKAILDQSKAQQDKVMESVALAELGYLLVFNSDPLQGAEMVHDALEMAEAHGDAQALSIVHLDLSHCMEDQQKAIAHQRIGLDYAERAGDHVTTGWCLQNLANQYAFLRQRDSAMYFAQRAYDLCLSERIEAILPYALVSLSYVHGNLYNEKSFAHEYLKKARACQLAQDNPEIFLYVHHELARFHLMEGRMDSAVHYADLSQAKLAFGAPFHALRTYALYKRIYDGTNADSALKYHRLHDLMTDSMTTLEKRQQLTLLLMKEELEQEDRATARARNLQFALIAVGILAFIIIFLLLSRSIITNTRVISFLGVVALLIVFEFLNLLLHPFLERVTHHSPLLMLLALVCIAALLVPLHHKLEKWATAKLVEKNKAIRLAEAKKTIEKLEQQGP